MNVLIVVDMQNDFIDGALGTEQAQAIVPRVIQKIEDFDGRVIATRDTHGTNYLETAEGRQLPVVHCVKGTPGWQLHPEVAARLSRTPVDKPTFGSVKLAKDLVAYHSESSIQSITLIGLCTDICVISNALLLKAFLPEVPIAVDASCCAGVTPQQHETALHAMQACQIEIIYS